MAYLDRTTDPNRRTAAIAAVIIIHALFGYVLVTSLVGKFVPPPHAPFQGVPIPLPTPPPPPPAPQPSQSAHPEYPTATPQPTPLPTTPPDLPPALPTGTPSSLPTFGTDTGPTGTPPHTLAFRPKPPVPTNDPRNWVTTDDYPARDLREENEGIATFRVVVGTNGRVSACEIVRSSGHAGLDVAICKAVTSRARFEPATDENGDKAVGTYTNSVRWQIPR